jgi:hypothetical protein
MAAQRKVFRIEEMLYGIDDAPLRAPEPAAGDLSDIMGELKALRTMIAARPPEPTAPQVAQLGEARKLKIELDVIGEAIRQTKSEITTLQEQGFDDARVARVAQELDAVVADTGKATDQILRAAEDIDEIAATLSAVLKTQHEQG